MKNATKNMIIINANIVVGFFKYISRFSSERYVTPETFIVYFSIYASKGTPIAERKSLASNSNTTKCGKALIKVDAEPKNFFIWFPR